jgi:hypothetical protein
LFGCTKNGVDTRNRTATRWCYIHRKGGIAAGTEGDGIAVAILDRAVKGTKARGVGIKLTGISSGKLDIIQFDQSSDVGCRQRIDGTLAGIRI